MPQSKEYEEVNKLAKELNMEVRLQDPWPKIVLSIFRKLKELEARIKE